MKCMSLIVLAAGASRVAATGGIGLAACLAGCLPLIWSGPGYAACTTGCTLLAVPEGESKGTPRLLPDGTVIFETKANPCVEACDPLLDNPAAYSACLTGCNAGLPTA